MAKLKVLGESVKIRLSREESAVATIETFGKPMEDDSDEVIETDISVSRDEYEELIEPLVTKTVALSERNSGTE